MGIVREEVRRRAVQVGEITAATARHQDFLAGLVGVVNHQHLAAAIARGGRTHQPGGTGADDDYVILGCGYCHYLPAADRKPAGSISATPAGASRSEERRVGKECR